MYLMNLDNQNLEWKLCEAYFSILEISMSSDISIDKLCMEARVSKEEVEKIVPNNPMNHKIFFRFHITLHWYHHV